LTASAAASNGSTKTSAAIIFTSSNGRSSLSVSTFSIAHNVVAPPTKRPKTVCLPSKFGQAANVMKLNKNL